MEPRYIAHVFADVRLGPLVRSIWSLDYTAGVHELPGIVAPDGQIEFVFQSGAPCAIDTQAGSEAAPSAMLYGLRHGTLAMRPRGTNRLVAFRLDPVVATAVLRSNLRDCWDRPVPLTELIGAEAESRAKSMSVAELEALRASLEAELPAALEQILAACAKDDWSDTARTCILKSRSLAAADKCGT